MPERRGTTVRYETVEAWEEHRDQVRRIITEDTGVENWPSTKSLPPMEIPPPLSYGAIGKLKDLKGVKVDLNDE